MAIFQPDTDSAVQVLTYTVSISSYVNELLHHDIISKLQYDFGTVCYSISITTLIKSRYRNECLSKTYQLSAQSAGMAISVSIQCVVIEILLGCIASHASL